jgi:hypothetical protein
MSVRLRKPSVRVQYIYYIIPDYIFRSDNNLKGHNKFTQRPGLEHIAIRVQEVFCFRNVQYCSGEPR